jgi:hypothetical protein
LPTLLPPVDELAHALVDEPSRSNVFKRGDAGFRKVDNSYLHGEFP